MRHITIIISILLLASAVPLSAQSPITGQELSLEFEETPLVAILNMIAQQNDLNLVISGDVTGVVSVRLDKVDIATALDALLSANDYTYLLTDNVIIIKPVAATLAGELESRSITLKYLDPVTASKALAPRLSNKGKVVILDSEMESGVSSSTYAANRILITEYPRVIDELVDLVIGLDVAERSIRIEARIIETKIDDNLQLGLNWPSSVSAKLTGLSDGSEVSGTSGTTSSQQSAGIYDPQNGSWSWGILSVDELRLVLDLLQQQGNSHLVSDPRITTLENHQAEFQFQTIVPVQTINRFTEGAATSDIVTFEDIEVGISLKVTPRISEGGKVTLDVEPKVEDIIGYSGPPDNQKPITSSRSIKTRISVRDGETVVLGGLLKEDEIETVKKVPLLGSIPLLGKLLFSHKSVEKTTTDLIIMITPYIQD